MTVVAALPRWPHKLPLRRARWELDDGDFVDVDTLAATKPDRPLVVVLHGLEGSSRAGYVRGTLAQAHLWDCAAVALNFRGCSGEPNRLARFYHSGDTGDLAWVVERLRREAPGRPIGIIGFSLGGNVLAKWFGEQGDALPSEVRAGIAISPPLDLARCAKALDAKGFWPELYLGRFLTSLKQKALAKAERYPAQFDVAAIRKTHSFATFDGVVTAPLHGFPTAEDYWERSSGGPFLTKVRRPLHILSADDDPFIPPTKFAGSPQVTFEHTAKGGHVAFLQGAPLWPDHFAEERALSFLSPWLEAPSAGS